MSNALRALAQKAKCRLKAITTEESKQTTTEKSYGQACLSARMQYALIASQKRLQDDPLYTKIRKMLVKDADITNPLAQLIEHNIYDNLDQAQKDKYIYKLSKRYVEIREQVLKEIIEEQIAN